MMALTAEQKAEAKAKLHEELNKLRADTLSYWTHLFRSDENFRKACGFSKGPEDMLQKLNASYEKKLMTIMKPFDRGDFD